MARIPTKTKHKPLTTKQRKWADRKLQTGNGTQAALEVYNTNKPTIAATIASENIRKPNVKAYLESKAERASEIVFDIAENGENDNVRLSASKDILDRAGYKPVERSEALLLHANLTQEKKEKLKGITAKVVQSLLDEQINRNPDS